MSGIPLPILILVVVLFLGFRVTAFFYKAYEDKQIIFYYLSERGATNIHTSWDVTAGTRDTYVYDVTYARFDGRQHQTRCTIGGSHMENEIYWLDPPEV